MAAQEERPEEIFNVIMTEFADEDVLIETDLRYSTAVVDGILLAAKESQVDVIVFRPWPANRLVQLVSGDRSYKPLLKSPYPLFILPSPDATSHG